MGIKDTLNLWDVREDTLFQGRHEFLILNTKDLSTEADPRDYQSRYYYSSQDYPKSQWGLKFSYVDMTYPVLNTYCEKNSSRFKDW